jgi:hypothetical protein
LLIELTKWFAVKEIKCGRQQVLRYIKESSAFRFARDEATLCAIGSAM